MVAWEDGTSDLGCRPDAGRCYSGVGEVVEEGSPVDLGAFLGSAAKVTCHGSSLVVDPGEVGALRSERSDEVEAEVEVRPSSEVVRAETLVGVEEEEAHRCGWRPSPGPPRRDAALTESVPAAGKLAQDDPSVCRPPDVAAPTRPRYVPLVFDRRENAFD